jgi:hypothetical protein
LALWGLRLLLLQLLLRRLLTLVRHGPRIRGRYGLAGSTATRTRATGDGILGRVMLPRAVIGGSRRRAVCCLGFVLGSAEALEVLPLFPAC